MNDTSNNFVNYTDKYSPSTIGFAPSLHHSLTHPGLGYSQVLHNIPSTVPGFHNYVHQVTRLQTRMQDSQCTCTILWASSWPHSQWLEGGALLPTPQEPRSSLQSRHCPLFAQDCTPPQAPLAWTLSHCTQGESQVRQEEVGLVPLL